jgi:hypothetical protein
MESMMERPYDTDLPPERESLMLSHVVAAILRYRYVILVLTAAVALLTAIIALAMYLKAPQQRLTTLPFKLEFQGADFRQYPNGSSFSTAEIVGTPILTTVYQANDLKRYLSFADFSRSIFILESNSELEKLARQYEGRLSDPKMTSVERTRLEEEFAQKRESLTRSELSINFLTQRGKIPKAVINKALSDVLAAWADYANRIKGVSRYRVPVLSRRVLAGTAVESADPLIAVDSWRGSIVTFVQTIDTLLTIPGTEVVATREQVTLPEIKQRLIDLNRRTVQPLEFALRSASLSPSTSQYLRSQLINAELSRQTAEGRVLALKNSLDAYNARGQQSPPAPSGTQPPNGSSETVMPQLTESFFDRLIALTNQRTESQYRQTLVDKLTYASMQVIPYEEEIEFYKRLIDQSGASVAVDQGQVARQIERIRAEVQKDADDISSIYHILSGNLSTSAELYSVPGPAVEHVDRATSLSRLAGLSLLAILLSIPLITAGCLIHNRIREEEQIEHNLHDQESSEAAR